MVPDIGVTPNAAVATPSPSGGVSPQGGSQSQDVDMDAFGKAMAAHPDLSNWSDVAKRLSAKRTEAEKRAAELEEKVKSFNPESHTREVLAKRAARLGFNAEAVEEFLSRPGASLDSLDEALDAEVNRKRTSGTQPEPKSNEPEDKATKLERELADLKRAFKEQQSSQQRKEQLSQFDGELRSAIGKLTEGLDDDDRGDIYDRCLTEWDTARNLGRKGRSAEDMVKMYAGKVRSRDERRDKSNRDKWEKELGKGRPIHADTEKPPEEATPFHKMLGDADAVANEVAARALKNYRAAHA